MRPLRENLTEHNNLSNSFRQFRPIPAWAAVSFSRRRHTAPRCASKSTWSLANTPAKCLTMCRISSSVDMALTPRRMNSPLRPMLNVSAQNAVDLRLIVWGVHSKPFENVGVKLNSCAILRAKFWRKYVMQRYHWGQLRVSQRRNIWKINFFVRHGVNFCEICFWHRHFVPVSWLFSSR